MRDSALKPMRVALTLLWLMNVGNELMRDSALKLVTKVGARFVADRWK